MRTAFVLGFALFALSGLGCTGNPAVPASDNPKSAQRAGALGFAPSCTCTYEDGFILHNPACPTHGSKANKPPKRLGS